MAEDRYLYDQSGNCKGRVSSTPPNNAWDTFMGFVVIVIVCLAVWHWVAGLVKQPSTKPPEVKKAK